MLFGLFFGMDVTLLCPTPEYVLDERYMSAAKAMCDHNGRTLSVSHDIAEAYKGAGGNAQYVLFPDFKKEGHNIFGDADGKALWNAPATDFLSRLE